MGRVGPTTASSTSEILTIQYFPNQTFIYTPTSAYATYRYGTSPHQKRFTSELPSLEDRIVDFPEGKVSVYTKFFEFANFCLLLSQFLFDIRWDFLDDVLISFGFGSKWRSWIRGSLSSGKASILVNGSPTPEFHFH
uniref:RNA-directed DNA polymerase, eukaryota, reverse transcriptase zinc-binding domain protein n=1 Tax=Tanacetum cinerariifolium TaxID=118510 RepID=A0A699J2S2_TANCI|nr:RNA-directed DNA polymerase, eukaryota, reverse transcriptase zinc-binding domain protein [Tanacetum cinerariifolium]